MSGDLPEPLTSADCDCTDLDSFMLNVERLLGSELLALSNADEFRAAVLLWCRAWKQVPAASLPNDERVLAAFSGAGPRWKKVREMALRGFVLCDDGRLYHRVLAEEAVAAYAKKVAFRKKREADAERLRKWRESKDETPDETPPDTPPETPNETRFVAEGQVRDREGTGKVSKKELKAQHPESLSATTVPSRAVPGGDLVKAGDACLEACGLDPARYLGDFRVVGQWLAMGLSLDRDIVPAIAEITRARGLKTPGWAPGSLGYFDKAMREVKPAAPATAPMSGDDEIRAYVRIFDRGDWPVGYGPAPGQPGSKVSAEQLAAVREHRRGEAA